MAQNFLTQIPVIGGLFDDSQDKYFEELEKNKKLYEGIELPELERYNPDQYDYTGDYNPELAKYETVSEDPLLRSAQMSALNKMAGLADVGLSDVDQAGFEKARALAGQVARGNAQAAMQNAQARGVSGSGLEYAMREMGNQEAAQRALTGGLDQAAEAARQRAAYNTAYGNMLGDVRGQDFRANSANTDIINRFNAANTDRSNEAQLRNLNALQNVRNSNVDIHNQAQLQNNNIANQNFNSQMQRAGGIAGTNTATAQGYAAQNAANQAAQNAHLQAGMAATMMATGGKKKKGVTDEMADAQNVMTG